GDSHIVEIGFMWRQRTSCGNGVKHLIRLIHQINIPVTPTTRGRPFEICEDLFSLVFLRAQIKVACIAVVLSRGIHPHDFAIGIDNHGRTGRRVRIEVGGEKNILVISCGIRIPSIAASHIEFRWFQVGTRHKLLVWDRGVRTPSKDDGQCCSSSDAEDSRNSSLIRHSEILYRYADQFWYPIRSDSGSKVNPTSSSDASMYQSPSTQTMSRSTEVLDVSAPSNEVTAISICALSAS